MNRNKISLDISIQFLFSGQKQVDSIHLLGSDLDLSEQLFV